MNNESIIPQKHESPAPGRVPAAEDGGESIFRR
jgi:hypothetical protein